MLNFKKEFNLKKFGIDFNDIIKMDESKGELDKLIGYDYTNIGEIIEL